MSVWTSIPDPDNAGGGIMKSHLSFLSIAVFSIIGSICSASLFASGRTDEPQSQTVTVSTYDSFAAEWGPGTEIAKRFKKATGYTVKYVVCGDSGAMLSKAAAEKNSPHADVLVGINNFMIAKTREAAVLEAYRSPNMTADIPDTVTMTQDNLLTPYDWGCFAIMYDTASQVPPPQSLQDLTDPQYRSSLVLMDPRISAPGLGFAAWTKAVYGDSYLDYWHKLRPSLLTVSPSWSTGYGLFTAGEAPLVSSYTTSMAYHLRYDKTDRYQALTFSDGHILSIEGIGLVKQAPNKKGGQAFIDFMLTKEAQEVLPETQWMYPALASVPLPDSFKRLPVPEKILSLSDTEAEAASNAIAAVLAQ